LILPLTGLAQQHYVQGVTWFRYQNQFYFTPNLYWNNEIDTRRFINPSVQNQLITHSHLHLRYNAWDIAAGLTYSRAYAAFPKNGSQRVVNELRPTVEGLHERRLKKFFLQNRIRLDHRFFEDDPSESIFESSRYVFRFRYRLQLRIPALKNSVGQQLVSVRLANEVMVNHTENFFDQNRIYATMDYFFSKNLAVEGGYIYIYQQRFGTQDFFYRHVIRLSLLHKLYR
jgi:hypothetical protein